MGSTNEYVRISDLPEFTPQVATAKEMAEILGLRHRLVTERHDGIRTLVVQTPDIDQENAFLEMLEDEIDFIGIEKSMRSPTVEMPAFKTVEDLTRWLGEQVDAVNTNRTPCAKKKPDCGGYMGFDCGDAGCRTCN